VHSAGLEKRAEIDERKYLQDEVAAFHAAKQEAAQREEVQQEANTQAARKAAIKKWNSAAATRREEVSAPPAPIPHALDAFTHTPDSQLGSTESTTAASEAALGLDDPVFLDVDRRATGDSDAMMYETVNGKLLEGLSSLKRLQNLIQRRSADVVALEELLHTLHVGCGLLTGSSFRLKHDPACLRTNWK
jgi:hypothetical protein